MLINIYHSIKLMEHWNIKQWMFKSSWLSLNVNIKTMAVLPRPPGCRWAWRRAGKVPGVTIISEEPDLAYLPSHSVPCHAYDELHLDCVTVRDKIRYSHERLVTRRLNGDNGSHIVNIVHHRRSFLPWWVVNYSYVCTILMGPVNKIFRVSTFVLTVIFIHKRPLRLDSIISLLKPHLEIGPCVANVRTNQRPRLSAWWARQPMGGVYLHTYVCNAFADLNVADLRIFSHCFRIYCGHNISHDNQIGSF